MTGIRPIIPSVTLCAVSSVNIPATLAALHYSMEQAEFSECLFFTDAVISSIPNLRHIRIDRLETAKDYSDFVVRRLGEYIQTSHCLLIQWDGFVLDAGQWSSQFLEFDYIGATWPQFADGHDVGNGGFSLRSRKLLDAGKDLRIRSSHPEDLVLCRTYRPLLEKEFGIRFADRPMAERFSYEREGPVGPTFGFHGIFNMIPAVGTERFWEIYRDLDDRSTAYLDFGTIFRQLGEDAHPYIRRAQFSRDRLFGR